MFWILIISLGVAYALQSVLSLRQMKAFSSLFVGMRRQGKVCMGKYSGGLLQGAIVLFLLDDDGRIRSGQRMRGVSVVARFQPFGLYDGQLMEDVDPSAAAKLGKPLVKALENAAMNFQIVNGGGQPPEPPTALSRLLAKLPSPGRRKKAPKPPKTRAPMPALSGAPSPGPRIVRRRTAVITQPSERS